MYSFGVVDSKKTFHECDMIHIPEKDVYGFTGERIYEGTGFEIKLPLKRGEKYYFAIKDKDDNCTKLKPSFSKDLSIKREIDDSYYAKDEFLIKYNNDKFIVALNRATTHLKAEYKYLKSLASAEGYTAVMQRIFSRH